MKLFRLRRHDGDAISCARVVKVLQAYVDGEVSELEARLVGHVVTAGWRPRPTGRSNTPSGASGRGSMRARWNG